MSEAKKLVPDDRSTSGPAEPLVFALAREEPAVDLREATLVPDGLPALDQTPLAEMPPEPETALLTMHRPPKKRWLSNTALILFLVGLFAFICGVALASAIVLGILDLQSGWVKDMLHQVKDLLRHHAK